MTLLLASIASAAHLVMALDSTEVAAGQTIGLTLQAVDAQLRTVPEIPASRGLKVAFQSQGPPVRVIDNFTASITQTLRYQVTASEPGEYRVGPLRLMSADGELSTAELQLRVTPRGDDSVGSLVADLSTTAGWVGQVVVYHLKYQTESRLVGTPAPWTPPDVDGLMAEPGVDPRTANFEVVDAGRELAVQEMWFPWRATRAGQLAVGKALLRAQFAVQRRRSRSPFANDPFFSDLGMFTEVRTENITSNPLSLSIRELPADGRPDDFSGLVGSFVLSITPSATRAEVGDTVTMDVELRGDGALAGFRLPAWTGEGFRVYDDEPVVESGLSDGRFGASAHFKRAIVPERPGRLELPPLPVSWFDPTTGAYARASVAPVALEVAGSEAAASVEGFGVAERRTGVESLADDILPVRTDARLGSPWAGAWAWALLAPGLLALCWEGVGRLRVRTRPAEVRAFGFGDLPAEGEARLAGIERIFREECGRRLDRPAAELMESDVAELGEEAQSLYRLLVAARYGGGGELPEDRVQRWVFGR